MSDTGPGISGLDTGEVQGEGLGLANVRERLKNMYGDAASFRLQPAVDGGLRVIIRIPEEREEHYLLVIRFRPVKKLHQNHW